MLTEKTFLVFSTWGDSGAAKGTIQRALTPCMTGITEFKKLNLYTFLYTFITYLRITHSPLSVIHGCFYYSCSVKPHIRGFSVSGLFCCCRAGGYSPVCGSPYRHQAHQREAFFIFRGYKKSMGRAVLKTSGYRDLTRPSL